MDYTNKKIEDLSHKIIGLASAISIQYLPDYRSRSKFISETDALIYEIIRNFRINCLSVSGAEKMFFFAQVKKEKINNVVNLILKQVGFVGGGTQILAEYGVCAATVGLACAAFGSSLVAHGLNNMFENGNYLMYRKDKPGLTRQGYRYVA